MAQTEVINLASETRAAPKNVASNYVAISPTAELVGGGEVFLSRNRKAVAKWQSGESRPSVFVTSEVGTVQQSVPYRAVGTAIVCDVIPMAQVLNLYAENGRLSELVARMAEHHADDLALALIESAGDVLAEVATMQDGGDAEQDGGDAEQEADMEVQPEELALG